MSNQEISNRAVAALNSNLYRVKATVEYNGEEVYELDGFDLTVGGAFWMAQDIADLLSKAQLAYYADILRNEIKRAEDSRLVSVGSPIDSVIIADDDATLVRIKLM